MPERRWIHRHIIPLQGLVLGLCCLSLEAQALTFTVPSVAMTRSDEPIAHISSHHLNPQVEDMSEGTWLTLQTDHGTLTLATTDGLSFEAGDGKDDSSMTFQGAQDVVNAALDGLVYAPEMGFAGQGTLSLSSGDVSASWHVGVHAPIDANAAREEILEGVTTIHSAVQPGRMVAYGPEAYDVAWYLGDVKEGPMMAIASWGKGRVLATPDHQTLNMHVYGEESGTFYANGLAWVAGTKAKNIKIVTRSGAVASWLGGKGYTNVVITNDEELAGDLQGAAVYLPPWMGTQVDQALLDTIADYVRGGGGLFIASFLGFGHHGFFRSDGVCCL